MPSQPNVEFVIRSLNGTVAETVRNLAINATAALQEETPVDTGFARASWVPRVGQKTDNQADPRVNTVNSQAALQQRGLASVAGYTIPDKPIFISNNTQYIQALDDGHSPQAEAGWIARTVEREVNALSGQS